MTQTLNVCVPTLRRYDLLKDLVVSLNASTIRPTMLHVIDNGRDWDRVKMALSDACYPTSIFTPLESLSLAESWNKFIRETTEERLICNDDVVFSPTSIEQLLELATDSPCVSGLPGNAFSCFLLRDQCVKTVGYFDESISPGYAYFEDCDYEERMYSCAIALKEYHVGIKHVGSATLTAMAPSQQAEHHRRFQIAQDNFMKKWGRLPGTRERSA